MQPGSDGGRVELGSVMNLGFLPVAERWPEQLTEANGLRGAAAVAALRALAGVQLGPVQVGRLDRVMTRLFAADTDARGALPELRLAILGSATVSHLPAAIRVAGLRRGLRVQICEGRYGMVLAELMDAESALRAFQPQAVLLAMDAHHVAAAGLDETGGPAAVTEMRRCWDLAREQFACAVIQQTVLPVFPPVLGNNEQLLAASAGALVERVNADLRRVAKAERISLLTLDAFARVDGLGAWHEPALWYSSKHEVHPRAAVVYGDQVARLLAALRGMSAKCLVLDLDQTLWGGVIGDDGLDGIRLGQGSAVGEAYLGFQRYCAALAARGVILAVCSKNDEDQARLPFREHPEMILREQDIAVFRANWRDKASNLREIARVLNVGMEALVFADDNPAERALVRRELPEVWVPEMPEDPARYAEVLAGAGYFEGVCVTEDDAQRKEQYRGNAERTRAMEGVTDMESYLVSLDMEMEAGPITEANLQRVVQLINKTNQFNVTTRRYTEEEVRSVMASPRSVTLQVRLRDRFGDNGVVAVVIARSMDGNATVLDTVNVAVIETWLMSCRVLGRRLEEACLQVLVDALAARGVRRLQGVYRPTAKNGMVRDLYPRLGFAADAATTCPGEEGYVLELAEYAPPAVPMRVVDEFLPARRDALVCR